MTSSNSRDTVIHLFAGGYVRQLMKLHLSIMCRVLRIILTSKILAFGTWTIQVHVLWLVTIRTVPRIYSYVFLSRYRVAGTVSAVLTCPLEVVKTRLQASTNTFHVENVCVPKIASTDRNGSHVTCKTIRSDQRRHFSLNYRLTSHMLTFSQTCTSNMYRSTESLGLIKCLK